MIREYLRALEATLVAKPWIASIELKRCDILETPSEDVLVYRFRIVCSDSGLLEMMERAVLVRGDRMMRVTTYCFHWQGSDGRIIRRWDNAPHFPKLSGFPLHYPPK